MSWVVVDVCALHEVEPRKVSYSFTRIGAKFTLWRLERKHRACPMSCCSFLWKYEIREL